MSLSRIKEIRKTVEVSLLRFKDGQETVEVTLSRKVDFLRSVFKIWVSDKKTRGSLFGKVFFEKTRRSLFGEPEIQKDYKKTIQRL